MTAAESSNNATVAVMTTVSQRNDVASTLGQSSRGGGEATSVGRFKEFLGIGRRLTIDTVPSPDPGQSTVSKVSPNRRAECAMAEAKCVDAFTPGNGGGLLPNDELDFIAVRWNMTLRFGYSRAAL